MTLLGIRDRIPITDIALGWVLDKLPRARKEPTVPRHASQTAMVTGAPAVPPESRRASERLFAMAYEELRRIAHQQRRRVGPPPTLNTTALVHEVYLKLSSRPDGQEFERVHFLALAARAMRQVLIDHARTRVCLKRGGQVVFTELDENHSDSSGDMADMLALDRSLTELTEMDPRAGKVVELYVFGGLRLEEIAQLQGLTVRTTFRDWRRARAFLVQRLGLIPVVSESQT